MHKITSPDLVFAQLTRAKIDKDATRKAQRRGPWLTEGITTHERIERDEDRKGSRDGEGTVAKL
jgi:hypothetical protein